MRPQVSSFGRPAASAALPNRAMSGTKPSPMLQLLALRGGLVIERGLIRSGFDSRVRGISAA